MRKLLVIGVGNPDRGDDGIGRLVVRRLAGRLSPDIAIIERSGDTLGLIEDWAGHDAVILVDAAAANTWPGRLHRVDLAEDELPAGVSLSSTHAFGVADAVSLARRLGRLPPRIVVFAIEGKQFDPGAPVSAEVAAALDEVLARVCAEVGLLERDPGHA